MGKRKPAYIASGRSLGARCPNCGEFLDGWTGAHVPGPGEAPVAPVPSAGDPTVCMYCAALLVFTNGDGDLRQAEAVDRERINSEPDLAKLLREFQRMAVQHAAGRGLGVQ